MASFDQAGAKAAGYSDSEIADYVGKQQNFDVAGARKAGYTDSDILGHLNAGAKPAATPDKNAAAPTSSAPPPQEATGKAPSTVLGAVKGAGDAALALGSGTLKAINTAGNDLLAGGDVKHSDSGKKLQEEIDHDKVLNYEPQTEEGKWLMGHLQKALKPVGDAVASVKKGVAGAVGERAANVIGDVATLATPKATKEVPKGVVDTAKAATKAGSVSTAEQIKTLTDNLTGRKSVERADVGTKAKKSIGDTQEAERKAGNTAYGELDKAMPAAHPVEQVKTKQIVDQHNTGIAVDAKVKSVAKELEKAKTFEDMKKLRTKVTDAIGNDGSAVDRQLKQVRDAITEDINKAAEKLGPEAKAKWDAANKQWAAYKTSQSAVNKILGKNWQGKTAEAVYDRIARAGKKSVTEITKLMDQMRDLEARNLVAGSILHHMSQKEGEFHPETLVKNWDKMDAQARSALFKSIGGGFEANMTKLVGNLKKIQEGNHIAKEVFTLHHTGTIGILAYLAHSAGLHGVAAGIAGVAAGARVIKATTHIPELSAAAAEKLLSNPKTVRALSNASSALVKGGSTTAKATASAELLNKAANQQEQK